MTNQKHDKSKSSTPEEAPVLIYSYEELEEVTDDLRKERI